MSDDEENPWEAPSNPVSTRAESIFGAVNATAWSGGFVAVLRGLLNQPSLLIPGLVLFVAHASPVFVFWGGELVFEQVGLVIFSYVWFIMPVAVTAADLWAARWWLQYFRTGERPRGSDRWPRLRNLRLAVPICLISFPWSFLTFFAFAAVSSQDLELPRTTLVLFYATIRGMHFFHAALYEDRPAGTFSQYFKGFRLLATSPLRVVALGLLFVVPIVVMDQFGKIPAVRVASLLLCLPGAVIVPGIAAYVFSRVARPQSEG